MAWTSPRTWVAGETVTAALLNTHLRDNLLELNSTTSVWSTWSPTISSFNGDGTIGNGTLNARYKQIGKTVLVSITFTGSTTSTWGTGGGRITTPLPVSPHSSSMVNNTVVPIGVWSGSSGVTYSALYVTATPRFDIYNGASGLTGTFNGATYNIKFAYEAA